MYYKISEIMNYLSSVMILQYEFYANGTTIDKLGM